MPTAPTAVRMDVGYTWHASSRTYTNTCPRYTTTLLSDVLVHPQSAEAQSILSRYYYYVVVYYRALRTALLIGSLQVTYQVHTRYTAVKYPRTCNTTSSTVKSTNRVGRTGDRGAVVFQRPFSRQRHTRKGIGLTGRVLNKSNIIISEGSLSTKYFREHIVRYRTVLATLLFWKNRALKVDRSTPMRSERSLLFTAVLVRGA